MTAFNFRRFIKIEASQIINDFIYVLNGEVCICDVKMKEIIGDSSIRKWARKYKIHAYGETIGWIYGNPKCCYIAKFLSYMVEHRIEMRDTYRQVQQIQREASLLERRI